MQIAEKIKNQIRITDLVGRYTELIPFGSYYKCKCPIHGSEQNAPMVLYPSTNSYYCFACESGGSPINFVADMEDIPYQMAMEKLAQELNININDDKEFIEAKRIEEKFRKEAHRAHGNLGDNIQYLRKRGFTDTTIDDFEFGWEKETLTIPIKNEFGQYVAMAKRTFNNGGAKYLNSYNNALYDKSKLLFNLDKALKTLKGKTELYLVEGYMDAISGHQLGLPTVAYCGNEIHRNQVRLLGQTIRKNITFIYCPDNDEEGLKRVPRAREAFKEILPRANVRVLRLPEGIKDMNDVLKSGMNVSELETVHIDKFTLEIFLGKCHKKEDEYEVVHNYLRTVSIPLIKFDIIKWMAERWERDYEELKEYFDAPQEDTEELTKNATLTKGCIDDLKRLYSRGEYPTHFEQLDNCIGGLTKKQVFVIGAFSGSGKSDLAIEYILRQIVRNKCRTIFFSLEMPKGKVMERIIAKIVGISMRDVRDLVMSGHPKINEVISKLNDYLIVYDDNDLSMHDIEARINAVNQKNILGGPVDLVVVDYFTYIKGANTFEGASEQALMMKGIAKKYNIILTMLSQISRKGNTYEEPTMDMLRMTGDIENSADVILMMWMPSREPNLSLEKQQKLQYITRLKVEKARDGMYGPSRMELKYNPKNSRLEEKESA